MFAKERHTKILEMLKETGSVTTAQLVDAFSVSIETIRRDLLILEESGMLQRVHGGAVAMGDMIAFRELPQRMQENVAQKQELCRTAMDFIKNGDTIGVDSGSTAVLFAEALKERFSDLTVITYSLDVFLILNQYKNFRVILCGGYYYPTENCFVGVLALNMLSSLHVQKVFLFPTAVSLQHGIFDHESEVLIMQQTLRRIASQVFVLADSSKFEHTDLLKQEDMLPSYIYVTDSALSATLKAMYLENHIQIFTEV
ncbi:MAG: DeoR/GlpR transcriptional regulator [Firmicutes bacterium]|nr:DeoR/GlpR transcriptional regulator [Bacillota bacterium]